MRPMEPLRVVFLLLALSRSSVSCLSSSFFVATRPSSLAAASIVAVDRARVAGRRSRVLPIVASADDGADAGSSGGGDCIDNGAASRVPLAAATASISVRTETNPIAGVGARVRINDTDEERNLLLDEIDNLTRSFETVQRTIGINKQLYETKTASLTLRIDKLERENASLQLRLSEAKQREELDAKIKSKCLKEQGHLRKENDELRKRLLEEGQSSARGWDEVKAKSATNQDEIASLEDALAQLQLRVDKDRRITDSATDGIVLPFPLNATYPQDESSSDWDAERDTLIQDKRDLSNKLIEAKAFFAMERNKLVNNHWVELKERGREMDEMRKKIESYEKDRLSLRASIMLGMQRIGSILRLGKPRRGKE